MTHCSEEDLVLHYYGDEAGRGAIAGHLTTCIDCSAAYRSLATTLELITGSDIPERGDSYPFEVWQRVRSRLPERRAPRWHGLLAWKPVTVAAAVATLVVAAFVAGRLWPSQRTAPAPLIVAADSGAGERVLLAAIGDHLDRSERVLLDLVNADDDRIDLSAQQTWAADLVDSNRLYRDAAVQAGDSNVAGVLDDLEHNLLEIVHMPSTLTPAELDAVRTRVDAAALLFKVRVLADELHDRERAPVQPRKAT